MTDDLFPAAVGIIEHFFKFAFKENTDRTITKQVEIKTG